MTGRAAEVTAVSAIALVITVAIAAPVLRAPSERIFGMEMMGRHHDPFTVMEQFGRPLALGAQAQPLTDIPGAWLARPFGPVAAYNWLILLTFPLSAAAGYLLARHLALSPMYAAIAAIVFAFSPFHLAHAAYHPHIAQTQWVPLYLLALWRCLDDSTLSAVSLLVLAAAAVTLSNFYGGLIAAVVSPVAIAAYWFCKSRHQPRSLRHLAVTSVSLLCIGACGVAYAWYAAHGTVVTRTPFGFERDDLFRFSAKWWSYLVPPVEHPLLGGVAGRIWSAAGVQAGLLEQQVSLGWGVVAAGLVAVFSWIRRDRQPEAIAAVPVLATVALMALVSSLSPERTIGSFTFTRPSALLYAVVPMFRSYARFGVVVQLMAALLAAIGAERLWSSPARSARIMGVALLVIAAGEYAVWPPSLWRDVLPTTAHRWVARQPGAVHALDCASLTPESESIQWLSGNRISLRNDVLDDCMEPRLADKLSVAGYTHLLVRRDTPEWRWFATQGSPDGLKEAARRGDEAVVFVVTAQPPPVYTERMTAFYPREYDQTWTWRWMGPDASWTVVNRSDRTVVAALDLEMTALHGARRLEVRLDGAKVQTLTIEQLRRLNRIGPFALSPGEHDMVFHPLDPPTVANDLMSNGDLRPLSFGVGTWRWTVDGDRP